MVLRKVQKCECEPGCSSCDECLRREFFEWNWDKSFAESTTVFKNNDREILFNPGFSVGTVAVRGTIPLRQGYHHYWEIEMNTEVYGTDMMIGVGTEKTDLKQFTHNFVSLIGLDEHSWGLSYMGESHHLGETHRYTKAFGQHTVIGVHLDLWAGTLEFYVNRKPQGIAFKGLNNKILYPMISSTAARSGMNLIFCRSYPPSLQLHTILSLGRHMQLPDNTSLFKVLALPPGLKMWMKNNYWWIVSNKEERKSDDDAGSKTMQENSKMPSQKPLSPRKKQKVEGTTVNEDASGDGAATSSTSTETGRSLLGKDDKVNSPASSSSSAGPGPSSQAASYSGRVLRSKSAAAAMAAINRAGENTDEKNTSPGEPGPGNKRMCLRSSVKKK